jgi:hypothetical protein
MPPKGTCVNEDRHPARGAVTRDGCPNKWVLKAGADGAITGYQTNKPEIMGDSAGLDSALRNLEHNSDGVFLEIYDELLLRDRGVASGGGLDRAGSGRTLAQWDQLLRERRDRTFPELLPVSGDEMRWRWTAPQGAGAAEIPYAVVGACEVNPRAKGTVHVAAR